MDSLILVANVPKNVDALIDRSEGFITKWTGNTDITTPPVSVATFTTNVTTLRNANSDVKTRTGTVQDRDAAEAVVRQNIKVMATYVQGLAEANSTRAAQIIVNAGFFIKAESGRKGPQGFNVESIKTGEVELTAPANEDKFPYQWQISTDGEVWTYLRASRLSVCTAKGLTPGELLFFRYCIIGEDNEYGEYSPSISCRIK